MIECYPNWFAAGIKLFGQPVGREWISKLILSGNQSMFNFRDDCAGFLGRAAGFWTNENRARSGKNFMRARFRILPDFNHVVCRGGGLYRFDFRCRFYDASIINITKFFGRVMTDL